MTDPDLIEETAEILLRPHFKIPAKSLGCHVCLFGHIFEGDGLVILVHDIIIDSADADPLMFAVSPRLRTGRQGRHPAPDRGL